MLRASPVLLVSALVALPAAAQEFGWSAGVTATSNYIFRGTTQSDDRPAVQGYVEGEMGIVFGGVWASTVDFPGDPDFGDDNVEFDLYGGIRPDLGPVSVEINYTRYLYDDSGDCCGEFGFLLGYPVNDAVEVGGAFYGDPGSDTAWLQAGGGIVVLQDYLLDGTLGTDFGTLDYGKDKVAWDLGVSRGFGEFATVDLRYHDSNVDPGRAVVSLSLDF
jgi:uncharacterized protein (TIGR02001 family)